MPTEPNPTASAAFVAAGAQPDTVFGACAAVPDVVIPAMGLRLWVRLPPALFDGAAAVIETAHAPGAGPPLHRHRETEVFRVLAGRYLMQVGERQFEVGEGEVVHVPGGTAHAFVNITQAQARQLVLITPGMQADVFFNELAALMAAGPATPQALHTFGLGWGVEFLGPPLAVPQAAVPGAS
ncbi:MAG TPA: cupin domain-containing protein [Stenotrophomonas sp.]